MAVERNLGLYLTCGERRGCGGRDLHAGIGHTRGTISAPLSTIDMILKVFNLLCFSFFLGKIG